MRYKEYILHYRKTVGDIRVEFYRGFNAGAPAFSVKEIGDVLQGLSLQIQGEQGDIDTPIVKTSLAISLVNAPDLNDGNMNGSWDFFAQGTETEWMVQLCREDDDLILWSGFVTPDSYSEEIKYRGSCSIVVRDNIGQLQNYRFDAAGDAQGMISMRELVNTAWSKVDNKMRLEWYEDGAWMMTERRVSAPDTLMNVSAFEEGDWYEALESVLYAYGAVLRYKGNNTFIVCPLRSLPMLAEKTLEPLFAIGASRELSPAVKQIEESVKFEIEDAIPVPKWEGFTGASYQYPCSVEADINGALGANGSTGTVNAIAGNATQGWNNTPSSTLFFNPKNYNVDSWIKDNYLEQEVRKYQYLAANNTDNRVVVFRKDYNTMDFNLSIKLGKPIGIHDAGGVNGGKIGYAPTTNLRKIRFTLSIQSAEQGATQYYYRGNGVWSSQYYEIVQTFDYKSDTGEVSLSVHNTGMLPSGKARIALGILELDFVKSASDYSGAAYVYNGLYAAIGEITLSVGSKVLLRSENTVITKYNDTNNLLLKRSPKVASAFDNVLFPDVIKNGIFEREDFAITPTPLWNVSIGSGSFTTQLAAGIHMQLLPYYAKPNNLISCTIVNGAANPPQCLYLWDGQEHLLMSGTYNYITGHLEGAVLREFARYDDIWQGATIPEIKEESTNK